MESFELPLEATGAELEISRPGGDRSVWPLARHYRIQEKADGSTTLWVRPVHGSLDSRTGPTGYVFDLAVMRSRALPVDELYEEGEALVGPLPEGGRLTIRPVSGDRRAELDAWDRFCLQLGDRQLDALFELQEDSGHGARE
jgi:hypothetical protein